MTTFSTFSAFRLAAPSTQRLQPRTRSVCSTFTNSTSPLIYPAHPFIIHFCASLLPMPTLHHFVPAPLPTSSSDWPWVHNLADFKKKLYFSWGVENYFSRLRPGCQTMSSLLPSTVQYSIPAGRPSSCWFWNALASCRRFRSMTASRSLLLSQNFHPTLHLIQALPFHSFVNHLSLSKAKHMNRRSTVPKLPSSERHLFSPSPPSPLPTPMSHIRFHLGSLQGLAYSRMCSRPPVLGVPLSVYEEDFDLYLPGLDLKIDIANGDKEPWSCAMCWEHDFIVFQHL